MTPVADDVINFVIPVELEDRYRSVARMELRCQRAERGPQRSRQLAATMQLMAGLYADLGKVLPGGVVYRAVLAAESSARQDAQFWADAAQRDMDTIEFGPRVADRLAPAGAR